MVKCLSERTRALMYGRIKTALETYGWDKLEEFDEVIMLNNTIMGPVYELSETFEKMDHEGFGFLGTD